MTTTPGGPLRLCDVGERDLLERIASRFAVDGVLVGIGDDAAVLSAPDSRVVVSTDVLVCDRHFKLQWSTAEQVGTRVAAANLADVSAMGARATGLVLALVAPPDTEVSWVLGFLDGVAAECQRAGAALVGGDLSSGETIVATGTALGDLAGQQPVRRAGAQVGDVVAVSGCLGHSAAGLAILSRGFSAPRALTSAFRCPQPPYDSGPQAAIAGATSMIDVSDGLVADAGHIARASGVTVDLNSQQLAPDETLTAAAAAFNIDPLEWVLSGGEDHSLLASFPSDVKLPSDFVQIGVIRPAGEQLVLVDGQVPTVHPGYEHFSDGV